MRPEICLNRCVVELRLDGHDFDAIAVALAECAVDALVAAGFRGHALDRGVAQVIAAMREHAAELRAPRRSAPARAERAGLVLVGGREP